MLPGRKEGIDTTFVIPEFILHKFIGSFAFCKCVLRLQAKRLCEKYIICDLRRERPNMPRGLQTFSAYPRCGDLKSGEGTGKGLDKTWTLCTIIAYLDCLHWSYRSATGMANDDTLEEVRGTRTYGDTTSETIAAN